MRHTTLSLWLGLICSTALVANAAGDGAQAAPAGNEPARPLIGEMHVQTLGAFTYCYSVLETDFTKLGPDIEKLMPAITKASEDGKVKIAGPFVLTYQGGAHQHPEQPFTGEVGLIVADGAIAEGEAKVRKVKPFKCATVLYTGPIAHIGDAYQKLFPAVAQAGLTPTGEEREFTLFYEGLDSPNNVILVQVGIQ
jgi:effector-binding domain-containing protein